jgi:hypothetical protein
VHPEEHAVEINMDCTLLSASEVLTQVIAALRESLQTVSVLAAL